MKAPPIDTSLRPRRPIAAGFFFAFYLETATESGALKGFFEAVGKPGFRDCVRVAGVVSVIYALYCFALPHTPHLNVPVSPTCKQPPYTFPYLRRIQWLPRPLSQFARQ